MTAQMPSSDPDACAAACGMDQLTARPPPAAAAAVRKKRRPIGVIWFMAPSSYFAVGGGGGVQLGGAMDRLLDALIGAAATDVSDGVGDVRVRRLRLVAQQRGGGHDQ